MVAQRLGFDEDEALTLAKAVAGLNAQAKGRRLGELFRLPGEGEWAPLASIPARARQSHPSWGDAMVAPAHPGRSTGKRNHR